MNIVQTYKDVGGVDRTYQDMREFRLRWSSGFVLLRKLVVNNDITMFRTRAQWSEFAPAFVGFVELSLAVVRRIRPGRDLCMFELSLTNEFLCNSDVSELIDVMIVMENTDMYLDERLIDNVARSFKYQKMNAETVDNATPIFMAMYKHLLRDIVCLRRKVVDGF
jgi:hypothetical protein